MGRSEVGWPVRRAEPAAGVQPLRSHVVRPWVGSKGLGVRLRLEHEVDQPRECRRAILGRANEPGKPATMAFSEHGKQAEGQSRLIEYCTDILSVQHGAGSPALPGRWAERPMAVTHVPE